jgi:hypothetical protein
MPFGSPRLVHWLTTIVPDALLVTWLALLPKAYFWRLETSRPADQMTIVEGDFTQEYFPVLVTAARALNDGALPLWNPLSNGGQPLLADPQAALLYPPTWLALTGLRGFDGDSLRVMEQLVLLHFALAGVFSYAMGRVLLGSRLAGCVCAVTFTYSGYLTSYPVQQLPILRTVTWFPLQVLCLWLAMERRSVFWAVAGGIAFGIAVLAGHPQTAFLEAVGLALVALVWAFQRAPAGRRGMVRGPFVLGVMLLIGFGVSAAQWVPTYEFTRQSTRPGVGFDFLSSGFSLWEIPLDIVAPRVLGGLPPYSGVLPLLLALSCLWVRRHALAGIASALMVAGLLLSLGGHTFLYPALYMLVPGFDLFRNQERSIFLYTLGVALLAGAGGSLVYGRLTHPERARLRNVTRRGEVLLVGLGGLGVAAYVWQLPAEVSGVGAQRWRDIVHWLFFAVLILSLGLSLLMARTRIPRIRVALPGLLVGLIVLDLFTVSWETQLQRRRPNEVFQPSDIVRRLQAETILTRVDNRGVLNGNHGLVYAIPTVTQSFALHLERVETAAARLPRERFYDLLNVRFVATREQQPTFGSPIVREQFGDSTNLLYEREPWGAAYIAPEAVAAHTAEQALEAVARPEFDPRRVAVIEVAAGESLSRGGSGEVVAYDRQWNRVAVDATAPTGGYLVLSEMWFPGWRAAVDGAPAPVLRANSLLRAVWLPPGEHRVVMTFEPESVRVGVIVSVMTALILAICLLFQRVLIHLSNSIR